MRVQNNDILSHIQDSAAYARIRSRLLQEKSVHISGVYGSFIGALMMGLYQEFEDPLWLVCATDQEALQVFCDMTVWSKEAMGFYPSLQGEVKESAWDRVQTIQLLQTSRNAVVVTSFEALQESVMDFQRLEDCTILIQKDQTYHKQDFLRDVVDAGYQHVEMVDMPGEFAARGGIVDIFPLGALDPIRIEFFGDDVEQLCSFDIQTQGAKEHYKEYVIAPSWELWGDLHKEKRRLLDCIPYDAMLVMKEPLYVQQQVYKRKQDWIVEDIWQALEVKHKLSVSLIAPEGEWADEQLTLHVHATEILDHDAAALRRNLDYWSGLDLRVYILCRHHKEEQHVFDFLSQHHLEDYQQRMTITVGSVSGGFVAEDCGLAVMAASDLFPVREDLPRRKARAHASVPLTSLLDLKEGDYVVHLGHGIAMFRGLQRLDYEGALRDYVKLEFKDEDVLYVPIEQVDLIQKYIGLEKAKPRLHRLGNKSWAKEKEKTEDAIKDLAAEMLKVQAQRAMREGFVYDQERELEEQFARTFPYEETVDQLQAIKDVREDMESTKPMDRLICGDVGYGKTEIALRAAFKAVIHHKQVALLVPTTVLAYQHFLNFKERMKEFPIRVEMLSRFRTRAEQKEVVRDVALGNVDIVIGTHRLLQKDIRFRDLGLMIVDEEQRFGVSHKERIKKMRSMVDILTMSATPIPRTLYMSLTGMREMSTIHTPPRDRLPVQTEVGSFDESVIARAIHDELEREGQVFFLHNRVKNIAQITQQIQKLVPHARIRYGHGQMSEKELETTIMDFVKHEFDVLVCTTIVESGVDIPNANTIIINNADMFGLAELYQLRGRVGRFTRKAYAYLFVAPNKHLPSDAQHRLRAIQEYSDLGAGYRIAMRDLELRGAGNLLGREQSGHIARIGFDLYCSLLRKHMKRMKGEAPDTLPATIDLKLDITIEPEFIPHMSERLDVYRRMAGACSLDELTEVETYVTDRYGHHWPDSLRLLLDLSRLKIDAGMKGYSHIGRRKGLVDLVSVEKHRVEALPEEEMSPEGLIAFVKEKLAS